MTDNARPANRDGNPSIPDYEVLKKIGAGSYGEVWLVQSLTGQYYAAKIIRRDKFQDSKPFEREFNGVLKFEPVSRTHPSQVDILHVGRHEAFFYYIMELADDKFTGRDIDPDHYAPKTLSGEMLEKGRIGAEDCIEHALALTTALEHLHLNGLAHRDIKPSNIIFVDGKPKLADLGLVSNTDATMSIVGTEGFIPPEGPGTPQADIYSLGKVIYEASTGMDRSQFPELPTNVGEFEDVNLFRELNAVIARACRNHIEQRYPSAEAMRADLLMISEGRSVRRSQILEKQIARLKQAAIILVLLSVLIGSAWIYQSEQTAKMAELAQSNETLANQKADLAETTAELAHEMQRQLLGLQMEKGIGHMEDELYADAVLWLTKALENVEPGSVQDRLHRIRIKHLMRRVPRLDQVIVGHNGKTGSAALSPDAKTLVTSGDMGGVIEFWDVATGERLGDPLLSKDEWVKTVSFQNEGTRLLSTGENWIEIWDVASRSRLVAIEHKKILHNFWVYSDHFAIASYSAGRYWVHVWDLETGEKTIDSRYISAIYAGDQPNSGLSKVSFSKNGKMLLFTAFATPMYLFDPSTGEEIRPPITLEDRFILGGFFHKNDSQIIAITKEEANGDPTKKGIMRISRIDWREGVLLEDLHTFETPAVEAKLWPSTSGNEAVYVSEEEDALLLFGEDDTRVIGTEMDGTPFFVNISKDGAGYYLIGASKHIRLESYTHGRIETALRLPQAGWAKPTYNQEVLLTENNDQSAKVWTVPLNPVYRHVFEDVRRRLDVNVRYLDNGNKLFVGGSKFANRYELGNQSSHPIEWEFAQGQGIAPMVTSFDPSHSFCIIHPDFQIPRSGGMLHQSEQENTFHLFNSASELPSGFWNYRGFIDSLNFDGDSKTFTGLIREILIPSDKPEWKLGDSVHIHRWSILDGTIQDQGTFLLPEKGYRQNHEMSPSGRYVAVPNDKALTLIEVASGEVLWSSEFKSYIIDIGFSHDESKLAISVADIFILLDTKDGRPIGDPYDNGTFANNFTFSPNDDKLAFLGNNTTKIFQLNPEPQRITEIQHEEKGANRKLLFNADGSMLLLLNDKGAGLYETKTGLPILPWLHSGEPLPQDDELKNWNHAALDADFHPRESEFAVAFGDEATTTFEIAPISWPVKDLQSYAEAMMGQTIDRDNKEQSLSAKEVKDRLTRVKKRHPEFWVTSTKQLIDFHIKEAAKCESNRLPDGVRLHLERIASFESSDPTDLLSIIDAQMALGKYSEVEIALRAHLHSESHSPRASAIQAIALIQSGNTSGAKQIMDVLVQEYDAIDDLELLIDLTLLSILYPKAVEFRQQLVNTNLKAGPNPQLAEYLAWLNGLENNPEQSQSILEPFLNTRHYKIQRKGMVLALCLAAYQQGNMPLAREYAYIYGSPEFPKHTSPTIDWRETMVLKQMEQQINTLLDIELSTHGAHNPPPLYFASRDFKCGPNHVDLSEHYNFSLFENVSRGRRSSELCSLSELPTGLVRLGGVDFDIRGGIQLNGRGFEENRRMQKEIYIPGTESYPDEVLGIRIDRQAQRLHFLHAGQGMFDKLAGEYVIHYQDGITEEIPLIVGENTGDWWRWLSNDHPNRTPQNAWEGTTPAADYQGYGIRLIKMTWENPHPEKKIASLDFISSDHDAAPFLIAITAE